MASKLSGTSSATFGYVKDNLGSLAVASVLPVVLMVIVGVANALVTFTPAAETSSDTVAQMPLSTTLISLVLGLAALFFYCWMVVKICRMYLDSEAPSLIGSNGSLRCGMWVMLYYLAAVLIMFVPMFILMVGGIFVFFAALGSDANSMISTLVIPGIIVALAVFLFIGWAQCRFIVGFVPLAFGEPIGMFDGWRISAGNSFGLFGRVVAVLLVWLIVALALMAVLGFLFSSSFGALTDPSGASAEAAGNIALLLIVQQLIFVAISVPFYWYTVVLFCEAYHRLTE